MYPSGSGAPSEAWIPVNISVPPLACRPRTKSTPACTFPRVAGTASGRDVDKFSGHGLTAIPALKVDAPIVAECGLHFECQVRLTQEMTADRMDPSVLRTAYPQGDLHTMFFGEILACYETD